MGENERVEIEGYKFFYNSNKQGQGGIIIGVKKELGGITIETERVLGEYQSLWVRIDNSRNKINIGCIYAPQESRTKIGVFREMYEHINKRINKAKHDDEKIVITGDFNAKIGNMIKGNREEVTKSGKLLKKMAMEQELSILNSINKCRGKWTRISGKEKSIIDYVMVFQEDERYVSSMKIDEDKEDTPRYREGKKTIYSDHCALITEIGWTQANTERYTTQKEELVINERALEKFNRETEQGELAEIMSTDEDVNSKYKKWQEKLTEIIKKSSEKRKKGKETRLKAVKKLTNIKKTIRGRRGVRTKEKKIHINNINNMIEEENKQHRARQTIYKAKCIQSEGKMHGGTFWEFKKQMDRKGKSETPSAMNDKEGEEKCGKEDIKRVFVDFYKELFTPTKPNTEIEKRAEDITNIVFEEIMKEAEEANSEEEIKEKDIVENINSIKNKVSLDGQGLSNKILKHAGSDMISSINILFREVDKERSGPDTWEDIMVKSIYKGKKCKKEMEHRRGIFMTSVINKLFERVKLSKQRTIIERKISRFQTGGIRDKSRVDNTMILNATIDYNILIGSETYVFFADAYKCFDKLDLRTCLIDYYEMLGAHETKLLYEMNKQARIVIKTPVGSTEAVEVKEITKQGTLFGPVLCNINTDKINKIGVRNISTIGPNIECEASIYVDDIEQAGSHINTIERTAGNCSAMEDNRKFTFNNGTDKTAFMIVRPKKESKEKKFLKTTIKRGKIGRTDTYRLLGEWYNERYDHETSLKVKENKIPGMIAQIKHYGDTYRVGNMALQVRIQIFTSTVIPTIYDNVETWSVVSTKEVERLEKMQRDILTSIMEIPQCTPYLGLLAEFGIWPAEQLIHYKRIMLLHQILTSEDTRFLKTVIEDQVRDTWKGCWIEQTREICEKYNLGIQLVGILKKGYLKRILKKRINRRLELKLVSESKSKTKMRFCGDFKRKQYTMKGDINFEMGKSILKLRLNMLELKSNYKGEHKNSLACDLCKTGIDNTEHLFECVGIKRAMDVPKIDVIGGESLDELTNFLEEVMKIKGIDSSKRVKQNLGSGVYHVSSMSHDCMKITVSKGPPKKEK